MIGHLQERGVKWLVNTGRDLVSLEEGLAQAGLSIQPDYLVVVEREIHCRNGRGYVAITDWNERCHREQEKLFTHIRPRLPAATAWIQSHFSAKVYQDTYSPFCLIAENNADADAILAFVESCFQHVPELTVVRNGVYARFSHAAYNKGTAMAEVARRLGVRSQEVFAAGDHWNDLPMLSSDYARYLAAPANAVEAVKASVRRQAGFVSPQPYGNGVAQALAHFLQPGCGLPDFLK
jgi:hydroxymethylpyrimidine pyrophosphatase-like HAD family hydrolase